MSIPIPLPYHSSPIGVFATQTSGHTFLFYCIDFCGFDFDRMIPVAKSNCGRRRRTQSSKTNLYIYPGRWLLVLLSPIKLCRSFLGLHSSIVLRNGIIPSRTGFYKNAGGDYFVFLLVCSWFWHTLFSWKHLFNPYIKLTHIQKPLVRFWMVECIIDDKNTVD